MSLCINPVGVTSWQADPPEIDLTSPTCDPNFNVTNAVKVTPPPGTNGSPLYFWATLPGRPGASWVSLNSTASDALNDPSSGNKFYIYDMNFSLPECANDIRLNGNMLAADAVGVYLNNHFIDAQPTITSTNYTGPPTPFSTDSNPGFFRSGNNELDFVVVDSSPAYTALDFRATLDYRCEPGNDECGFCQGGSWCTIEPGFRVLPDRIDGIACYPSNSPKSLENCGCGFCQGTSWCTCDPGGVCYLPSAPQSIEHCRAFASCDNDPSCPTNFVCQPNPATNALQCLPGPSLSQCSSCSKDVFWNICAAGSVGTCDSTNPAFLGQSSFDLSCSDVDMNAADDCGRLEGNNKLEQGYVVTCLPPSALLSSVITPGSDCVNGWQLEGLGACSPSAGLVCGSTTSYVCTQPITTLSMKWTGPVCVRIAGVAGTNPATPFNIDNVCPGETVTVAGYNCPGCAPTLDVKKGKKLKTSEGVTFSTTVATFTDRSTSDASEYSATIDWGDGTPASTGVIVGPTGGPFNVSGSHTYAEEGTYSVTVTVTEALWPTNTGSVTLGASVGTIPLTMTCAVQSPVPSLSFSGGVATFTHVNPLEGSSAFTATINWGDASAPTTGTVTGSSSTYPTYTVTGSHAYSAPGTYTIAVTVIDDGEATTRACRLQLTPTCVSLDVSATGDPWLAGMPSGSTDVPPNSSAPANSPTLVPIGSIVGGFFTFSGVTGTPNFNGNHSSTCEGHPSFQAFVHGPANSMAALTAPANSLVGVFLDANVPTGAPPPALNFSTSASQNFATLSPMLRQPFFIGNGLTSTSAIQRFLVPTGATRLFLGTMDQQQWTDNIGKCRVQNLCYSSSFCGNNTVDPGETCDPPGSPVLGHPGVICRADCTFCGDGVLQAGDGEQCDDGNNTAGDGCSPTCLLESCQIRVDKQVSCDGVTWYDLALVSVNEDGTLAAAPCCSTTGVGYTRYFVNNIGLLDVGNCTLTEANTAIGLPPGLPPTVVATGFGIPANTVLGPTAAYAGSCPAVLSPPQPDIATLSCTCQGTGVSVTAFDRADIQ